MQIPGFFVGIVRFFCLLRRTIQFDIMAALVFIAVITAIIINLFYYQRTNEFIETKVLFYDTEIVRQTGNKVDDLIAQVERKKTQLISMVVSSDSFQGYGNMPRLDQIYAEKRIDDFIKIIGQDIDGRFDIYIIGAGGNVYSTNRSMDRKKLLQGMGLQKPTATLLTDMFVPMHTIDYYWANPMSTQKVKVVSFIKNIAKISNNTSVQTILIDLKYDQIKNILSNTSIGEGSTIVLTDEEERVIFSSKDEYVNMYLNQILNLNAENQDIGNAKLYGTNQNVFAVEYNLPNIKWKIMGIIPRKNLEYEMGVANKVLIFVMSITILFSLLLSLLLAKRITLPIKKLIKNMKKVGEGNFKVGIFNSNYKDIQILDSTFNSMVEKINELMRNVVEKELEKANAELKALQAQINPHFLYNTLEVTRSIALDYEAYSIEEICMCLADLFRYSISKNKETVTIQEEIEHIRNYINIQKYRYGNKLNFTMDIDENVLACKTLKLVIQPLVENAVYHGIEMKIGPGTIHVLGTKSINRIIITISDDGVGIPDEKVHWINAILKESHIRKEINIQSGIGIGITNVNSRIKLYYGDEYGLHIDSMVGKGTVVTIVIPEIY